MMYEQQPHQSLSTSYKQLYSLLANSVSILSSSIVYILCVYTVALQHTSAHDKTQCL